MKKNLIYLSGLFLVLSGCNLEKEIDLELPDYKSQVVVECYLEPGQPYRLALTESVSYFDPVTVPTVDNALVTITHNGIVDTLKFGLVFGPGQGKAYNYSSPTLVPADYISEFYLEVRDLKGRVITGNTRIPTLVSIDTVEFRYNKDSLAFPLTRFTDDQSTPDYYRYQVTRDTYVGDEIADATFDDRLSSSSIIAIGSSPRLEKGDFVIVSLYHITEDYFEFTESVSAAIDANGNPFGQPASVRSNVQGGIGIFTGISVERKEFNTP